MKITNSNSVAMLAIWIGLFGSLSIGIASEPMSKPLIDFQNPLVAEQWISVNDNVMGGISEGGFRMSEDNTLVFSGNLSLENRGGFASIRTRPADLELDGYDTIVLRVKGDGRTYYVNLRNSSGRGAGSYRAPLKTQKNTWQEARIAMKEFEYTAFGRRVRGVGTLRANEVQSVGFTLADKNAGPFRLEVSSIRAEKATARSWADSSDANKDIVETAAGAGQFNTLVQAVGAAGLVDTLKRPGPFTVFAPTDGAFAKLPKGTLESLLKPQNRAKLVDIRRGVPLFNAGQPSACAAIYEVTVESLLKSHTNAFSDKDRSVLQNALSRIRSGHQDASEQAWTLRRALDVVYKSLSED